jgi:hypothetical protein
VVNLPLTDEEIKAKFAELARKVRESIQASSIETNLRLLESQLHTAPKDLIALYDHLNKLNEKLDFFLEMGKKIKEMERQVEILVWGLLSPFYSLFSEQAVGLISMTRQEFGPVGILPATPLAGHAVTGYLLGKPSVQENAVNRPALATNNACPFSRGFQEHPLIAAHGCWGSKL